MSEPEDAESNWKITTVPETPHLLDRPPVRLFDLTRNCFTQGSQNVEPYAILSHRWGDHELTYERLKWMSTSSNFDLSSYPKFDGFCKAAQAYGCRYVWIDTACINKKDKDELDLSIASMFWWYRRAQLCIVYLADVSTIADIPKSSWFTRGWTLQEFLASKRMVFYLEDWTRISHVKYDVFRRSALARALSVLFEHEDGEDDHDEEHASLMRQIVKASGVEDMYLTAMVTPSPLEMDRILECANHRHTSLPEDSAYSLFSLLDIYLPTNYGEGRDSARQRLIQVGMLSDVRTPMKPTQIRIVSAFRNNHLLCVKHRTMGGSPTFIAVQPVDNNGQVSRAPDAGVYLLLLFTAIPFNLDDLESSSYTIHECNNIFADGSAFTRLFGDLPDKDSSLCPLFLYKDGERIPGSIYYCKNCRINPRDFHTTPSVINVRKMLEITTLLEGTPRFRGLSLAPAPTTVEPITIFAFTTMYSLTDLAEQRRRIDEQIAIHEAEIWRLKSQRNSLSAAYNLPSDIISVIATIYKDLTVLSGRKSWMNILGVCSPLRRVIVDLPQFWATISSDDSPFLETMLQRSRHIRLRLHYSLDYPFSFHLWQALLLTKGPTKIDTISLSFGTDSPTMTSKLIDLIHYNLDSLPSIRKLTLSRAEFGVTERSMLYPESMSFHLPCQLLSPHMTSLSSLELTDIFLSYDVPPLPSLRNLIVSCTPSPYGLSIFDVSCILRKTPNIEQVHLGVLSKIDDDEVEILPISVPTLNTLYAETEGLEGFKLFTLLDTPKQTRITITLDNSYALTSSRSSEIMTGFRGKPLRKVSIHRNEFFGEFTLHLYSPSDESPFLNLNLPSACFDVHHYTEWSNPQAPPPLSFGSVTELTIDDNTLRVASSAPLAWNELLNLFKKLKVLNLANIQPNELPAILQSVVGTANINISASPNTTFNVTLGIISFSCIDWTFVKLETLSLLHERHLKLVITKCTIDEEQVDRLRQYVSVDWDGVTREEAPRDWWLFDFDH
ncbi:hypothetical protein ONZ45_g10409 [Pleurotus djamor]|nr:hypothetical protein ONZ45_g10409 [Pleurotus djamor]